ncbi:hypothetical protein QVD17_19662 [Tagetes erecta]|uniref:Uncharacterized protein n=1 Tax=Tagetes erecta TaxID=13708 RepID=A0AAD8NQB2_TARER|nr:hypothetical protein QVD17_19662 [Tagetes erecta]
MVTHPEIAVIRARLTVEFSTYPLTLSPKTRCWSPSCTKGKRPLIPESKPVTKSKKAKRIIDYGLDEDEILNLKTSLENQFSMVKTKLGNLEERERHREAGMEDIRKLVVDQQCLIKKILTYLK